MHDHCTAWFVFLNKYFTWIFRNTTRAILQYQRGICGTKIKSSVCVWRIKSSTGSSSITNDWWQCIYFMAIRQWPRQSLHHHKSTSGKHFFSLIYTICGNLESLAHVYITAMECKLITDMSYKGIKTLIVLLLSNKYVSIRVAHVVKSLRWSVK